VIRTEKPRRKTYTVAFVTLTLDYQGLTELAKSFTNLELDPLQFILNLAAVTKNAVARATLKALKEQQKRTPLPEHIDIHVHINPTIIY